MTRFVTKERAAGRTLHQALVTHCLYDEGLYRQAGFGVRASSTQNAVALRFASEYPTYEVPAGWPSEQLAPQAVPRRLALVPVPGGKTALIHSAFLPEDGRGRANNFLSHVVFGPAPRPADALATWASPEWAGRCAADTPKELQLLGHLPRGGTIDDAAVTAFLRDGVCEAGDALATLTCPARLAAEPRRRRELVAWTLRGCSLALPAGPVAPRGRLYFLAEPGLTALLLYAAARLLPEALAARLTFSTYEDAHRTLRAFRHAQAVGTWLADPARGLDEEYFTARGYALDASAHRASAELQADAEQVFGEWLDLAAAGEWDTIDKAHRLLGKANASVVSFQEALAAARLARRLERGEAQPRDLLALKQSSLGGPILEQHKDAVWLVVRDASADDAKVRAAFADVLRGRAAELEGQAAEALKAGSPAQWQPHWRLLAAVLEDDPSRLGEAFLRVLPEPPFPGDLRLALLRQLHELPLAHNDVRLPLHALLKDCAVADLDQLAASDLPPEWYVWALCYAVLRPETRPEAVRRLHEGPDDLVRTFWDQFRLVKDEAQRRAILAPLFPPGDPASAAFLSRLLHLGGAVPADTLQWLLDRLRAVSRAWADYWGRDNHLGQLLDLLRQQGDAARPLWDRLCARLGPDVLLPGPTFQKTLLLDLAAAQARPGPAMPAEVARVVSDWVLLREHFEKACAVGPEARAAVRDACNRRGLDPVRVLESYFSRFVRPQGANREVQDDFAGFFHSFYPEGEEYPDHSSRLIGWLQVVRGCADEAERARFQLYYLENCVPAEFRWRLADDTCRAGKLLPAAFRAVPPPTAGPDAVAAARLRAEFGEPAYQLTGVWLPEALPFLQRVSLRGRLPWLLGPLAVGLLAALWGGPARGTAARQVPVALFVPLVLLLADAVAGQSAGVAVRALRRHNPSRAALLLALRHELLTGLVLGLVCGLLSAGASLLAAASWGRAVSVGLAVLSGTAAAACLGLGLPVLLWRRPQGVRLASGPVVRAAADGFALLLYVALARSLGA